MLPSWLWTLILFLILVPIHTLVIVPAVEDQSTGVRISIAGGYVALGLIWAFVGDRLGIVRR